MKLIASLSAAVLAASTFAAHASTIQPFGAGTTLLLDGHVVNSADINLVHNGFWVADHGSLLTVTYVETPQIGIVPETGILNVTDVCLNVAIGFGGRGTPCQAVSLSFTDAEFGAVDLGVAVGVGVTESVSGNTALVNFAENGQIGIQSGTFTFVDPIGGSTSNSPVPEPGTLGMMATGLLGAAGAIRRRFQA